MVKLWHAARSTPTAGLSPVPRLLGGSPACLSGLIRRRTNNPDVILGHLQRGGMPTAADRLLGTKLGGYDVDLFLEGSTGVMAGEVGGKLMATPLRETFERKKPLDDYLLRLHCDLSQ